MDTRTEITKLWKDVQASAKEFAHYGLQATSKALDVAATRLKTLEKKLSSVEDSAKSEGKVELKSEPKADDKPADASK